MDERFASVMGECVISKLWVPETIGDPSIFKLIRKVAALARMLPTFDLSCEENATRR